MEAPGLSDASSRQRAAGAITAALKRDGQYMIVFVITLESGRVRLQAKELIALVLRAAPIGQTYTVIVNNVTERADEEFKKPGVLDAVKHELFSLLDKDLMPTNNVILVKKGLSQTRMHLPQGFRRDAPRLYIQKGRVGHVHGETPKDVVQALDEKKSFLEEESRLLNDQLRKIKEGQRQFELGGRRYIMSKGNYDGMDDDWKAKAIEEFGPGAKPADFEVLMKANATKQELVDFLDQLGRHNFRLMWQGQQHNGNRIYFAERHNGSVPSGWLVHQTIHDNLLDLGSWMGGPGLFLIELPTPA